MITLTESVAGAYVSYQAPDGVFYDISNVQSITINDINGTSSFFDNIQMEFLISDADNSQIKVKQLGHTFSSDSITWDLSEFDNINFTNVTFLRFTFLDSPNINLTVENIFSTEIGPPPPPPPPFFTSVFDNFNTPQMAATIP